ncbi:hypothetical protein VPH35_041696 [Triticum aestivum]
MPRKKDAAAKAVGASLPVDMLANIHGRLSVPDRLAFAAAFPASRDAFRLEPPCLFLPGDAPENATLFSLADCRATATRIPGPGHTVLGSSSRAWLVTADDRAQLRLVNAGTGELRALPAIDTIPFLFVHRGCDSFWLEVKWFLRGPRAEMRHFLYSKVVLSDSAEIPMLVTGPDYGVVAFAMAGDGAWRLPPPRDGVEPVATLEAGSWRLWHSRNGVKDAVNHEGMFYSITYSGEVEAWEERDTKAAGVFTSAVVAQRLLPPDAEHRKYLVGAPGGRLMVVLKVKETEQTTGQRTCSFKVQVLDSREGWKETDDIGDNSLFVGGNSSLCVSTREHPELRAGCVYYTEDDLRPPRPWNDNAGVHCYNAVGVFSLKDGSQDKVEGLGRHRSWPPPAWFTPSTIL